VRIVAKADATDAAATVVFATDAKAMQVGVIPAHGDLQGIMEIGDGAITADQQPAPDQRCDLTQPDVQLIDFIMDEGSLIAWQAYHDELPCPAGMNARSPHFVMVSMSWARPPFRGESLHAMPEKMKVA
jgi:hypothetical protein